MFLKKMQCYKCYTQPGTANDLAHTVLYLQVVKAKFLNNRQALLIQRPLSVEIFIYHMSERCKCLES